MSWVFPSGKGYECPTCFDFYNVNENKPIIYGMCGHTVCNQCRLRLLDTLSPCPVCRSDDVIGVERDTRCLHTVENKFIMKELTRRTPAANLRDYSCIKIERKSHTTLLSRLFIWLLQYAGTIHSTAIFTLVIVLILAEILNFCGFDDHPLLQLRICELYIPLIINIAFVLTRKVKDDDEERAWTYDELVAQRSFQIYVISEYDRGMVLVVPPLEATVDPSDLTIEGFPDSPGYECPTCLAKYNFNKKKPMIYAMCGHTICYECREKILEQFYKTPCPICQNKEVIGLRNRRRKVHTVENKLILDELRRYAREQDRSNSRPADLRDFSYVKVERYCKLDWVAHTFAWWKFYSESIRLIVVFFFIILVTPIFEICHMFNGEPLGLKGTYLQSLICLMSVVPSVTKLSWKRRREDVRTYENILMHESCTHYSVRERRTFSLH